jgi:hypothetical protein
MVTVPPSAFIRRLAEFSKAVVAMTSFLEHVAGLLRQLVHVTGWLVVLSGSLGLMLQPHLSPEHLITPGAGVLAVLQGYIKHGRQRQPGGRPSTIPLEKMLGAGGRGGTEVVDLDDPRESDKPEGSVSPSSDSELLGS